MQHGPLPRSVRRDRGPIIITVRPKLATEGGCTDVWAQDIADPQDVWLRRVEVRFEIPPDGLGRFKVRPVSPTIHGNEPFGEQAEGPSCCGGDLKQHPFLGGGGVEREHLLLP